MQVVFSITQDKNFFVLCWSYLFENYWIQIEMAIQLLVLKSIWDENNIFDSVDHFLSFDCDMNAKKPIYTYVNTILSCMCNCQLTKKREKMWCL